MNNKPNEWEQNIIDNAVEYSIMEWRPLDKSTKTIVKTYDEAKKLYDLAVSLDKLGAQVILIECLENSLAKKISQNCSAPVIGIGSGSGIDGQVAVIYDLLGISFNKIDTFFINDKTSLDKQITKFVKKLKLKKMY